jgi:WD40 repeat protein
MSEHKKTITAISWSPDHPDLFASASADNLLIVWNVAEQKAVARLDNTKGTSDGMCVCVCVTLMGPSVLRNRVIYFQQMPLSISQAENKAYIQNCSSYKRKRKMTNKSQS